MAQRLVYIIVTGHLYNPFGRFIQIKNAIKRTDQQLPLPFDYTTHRVIAQSAV